VVVLLAVVDVGKTPIFAKLDAPIGDFLLRSRNALDKNQPVSPDITLIGIDDYTFNAIGPYGKGDWVWRKPFCDQVPYFKPNLFNPKVVAYDIVFKELQGKRNESAQNILEDRERLTRISDTVKLLAAEEISEIDDDSVLTDIATLTFQFGDISLAHAIDGLSDDAENAAKVIAAYYLPEDSQNMWTQEAILGDDPDDLSEDNGLEVPYLRDVRIPMECVKNLPPDYSFYPYAVSLPGDIFLDYVKLGFIDVPRDNDGLVRRVQLVRGIEYKFTHPESREFIRRRFFVPSFALLSCLYFWGIDLTEMNQNESYAIDGEPIIEIEFGKAIRIRRPNGEMMTVPIDEYGRLFLDFVGRIKDFNSISFAKVIEKPVDEIESDTSEISVDPRIHHRLNNKLVMIGTTATAATDIGPCPVDANTPFVHIHMIAASNILTQTFLRPLGKWGFLLILSVFWLVMMPCSPFVRPLTFSFVLAALGLAYLAFVYLQVHLHKHLLPVSGPMVFLLFSYLGDLLFYYLSEEREKRKIRGMFSTMVSGDVLEFLEENPESFSLAGQKQEATMFFSDVAGFTTISESLDPAQLVDLLNQYLSPMTDIIMDYNGYVDKYEGDAIMAEWGVPYPQPEHARLACWAALDQQARLDALRPGFKKEFGVDVHVRMGINSGIVSAGNMGSQKRFSYTVMGDAVNQAARFEPANKDYNTLIMIGESTWDLAKDHIEGRLLDKIIVKGKTVPIQIYELAAKKGDMDETTRRVLELYDEGLRIHWDRWWDDAMDCFKSALKLIPGDGPSITMIERIEGYKNTPPPDNWHGEFVRASKD